MIFQNEVNQILEVIQANSQSMLSYGAITLFCLLALGIVALPIPDETLLLTAGFLISKGALHPSSIVFAAYMGAISGISLSYVIGRYGGSYLLEKYGHWVRLTEPRIERTRHWFSRLGLWTLFFGYFIPGVRHFTGYLVGSVRIPFNKFASFAFSGAIVWASTFLSVGYFLGTL